MAKKNAETLDDMLAASEALAHNQYGIPIGTGTVAEMPSDAVTTVENNPDDSETGGEQDDLPDTGGDEDTADDITDESIDKSVVEDVTPKKKRVEVDEDELTELKRENVERGRQLDIERARQEVTERFLHESKDAAPKVEAQKPVETRPDLFAERINQLKGIDPDLGDAIEGMITDLRADMQSFKGSVPAAVDSRFKSHAEQEAANAAEARVQKVEADLKAAVPDIETILFERDTLGRIKKDVQGNPVYDKKFSSFLGNTTDGSGYTVMGTKAQIYDQAFRRGDVATLTKLFNEYKNVGRRPSLRDTLGDAPRGNSKTPTKGNSIVTTADVDKAERIYKKDGGAENLQKYRALQDKWLKGGMKE